MKKILLLLVPLIIGTATIGAQNKEPEKDFKHTVSVGYGYFNLLDFAAYIKENYSDHRRSGTFMLGYTYKLSHIISLGGIFGYSERSATVGTKPGSSIILPDERRSWCSYSIMPQIKFSWYNRGKFSAYSRVALGVYMGYKHSYNPDGSEKTRDFVILPDMQVSPIGIEFGGALAGYLEAGFGSSGVIQAGISYRF